MDAISQTALGTLLNGPPGSVHLLGITGAGMKALAEVLHDLGWAVSGCDADPDPVAMRSLSATAIPIASVHDVAHLEPCPDLLIHSPAVPESQIERRMAADRGIPQSSYVDAVRELTRNRTAIAVAGTHGKSTTTAMIGHILTFAGRKPMIFCGAELQGTNRNGQGGSGEGTAMSGPAVVEACEYRRHFLGLSAPFRCVLGIETDHFDCFPGIHETAVAFTRFVEELPRDGALAFRADCPVTRRIVNRLEPPGVSFALKDRDADWSAEHRQTSGIGTTFTLRHRSGERRAVRLPVPGRHNVANALAAMAAVEFLGVPLGDAIAGLESFPGLRRRFEVLRNRTGGPVVDDYAHHPTELRAVLETAREVFPGRRITCVFQPHQVSRTVELFDEFAAAIDRADCAYVLPVHAAREQADDRRSKIAAELAEAVSARGTPTAVIPALDRVWTTLQTDGRTDDVILTLGAGTITRIHHEPY